MSFTPDELRNAALAERDAVEARVRGVQSGVTTYFDMLYFTLVSNSMCVFPCTDLSRFSFRIRAAWSKFAMPIAASAIRGFLELPLNHRLARVVSPVFSGNHWRLAEDLPALLAYYVRDIAE